MIRVELLTPRHQDPTVTWARLATLEADGNELHWLEGDPELLNPDTPVIDLRNNRQVRASEDAEAWVRGLETIFRSGEIVVNVLEDTDPIPVEDAENPADHDSPMQLHDHSQLHEHILIAARQRA